MSDEKILLDVEIKATEALKELAELKDKAAQLRAEQKELDTTTAAGRERYLALGEQIKAVNKEANERSKIIQSEIKQQNQQTNSLNQMAKHLSQLRNQYRDLSEEQRNSPMGKDMLNEISALNDKLFESESAYGSYTRNVGNYSSALDKLFPSFGKLTGGLQSLMSKGFGSFGKGLQVAGKQALKFGVTLMATPIGWITAALVAVVAVFKKVVDAIKKNDNAMTSLSKLFSSVQPLISLVGKAFEKLAEGIGWVAEKLANFIGSFSDSVTEAQNMVQLEDDLEERERQYTENSAKRSKDIAEIRAKTADKEKYTAKERMELLEQALELEKQDLEERKSIQATKLELLEYEAKKNNDTSDEMKNKLSEARAAMYQAEEEYNAGIRKLQKERSNAEREQAKEQEDAAKKVAASRIKALEQLRAIEKEHESQIELGLSDDFNARQAWAAKQFAVSEKYEQDKLAIQRKFGQITAKEYDTQLQLLAEKRKTFEQKQLSESQKNLQATMDELKSLVDKSTDEQLSDVDKKYSAAREKLNEMAEKEPVQLLGESDADFAKRLDEYKDFMFDLTMMAVEMEEKAEKEKAEIVKNSQKALADNIDNETAEQYQHDLLLFADNEAKKTEIEIAELQRRIAEKKAAGLETLADENALRELQAKQNQQLFAKEISERSLSERQKYNITVAAIEREQELYQEGSDRWIELERQKVEAKQNFAHEMISIVSEYSQGAMDLANAVNGLMNQLSDNEVEKARQANEEKNAALQEQLDAGLMGEEEYNRKKEENDAKLRKIEKEEEIKKAKREKAVALVQAIIQTALAIANAVAQNPMMGGLPGSAIAAAMGAVQIATIAAQPIPQAARGGIAGGGLLVGASHANGGIHIEAEGGEAIINKRSTARYRGLLSAINAAGGGVRFANGGVVGDGGFAARQILDGANAVAKNDISQLTSSIANMKIYTAVTDIHAGEQRFAQIQDNSNF